MYCHFSTASSNKQQGANSVNIIIFTFQQDLNQYLKRAKRPTSKTVETWNEEEPDMVVVVGPFMVVVVGPFMVVVVGPFIVVVVGFMIVLPSLGFDCQLFKCLAHVFCSST